MPISEHSSSPARLSLLPLWQGKAVLIVAGLLLTLCLLVLLTISPLWLRQADLRLYDLMVSARPSPALDDAPVMVGIDEESLTAYGQWPWPRYRLARLVDGIRQLGAEVIVLDVLMPEPDRTSPDVIMAERQRDFGVAGALGPSVTTADSNSQVLAAALKESHSIIGCYFDFSPGSRYQDSGFPNVPAQLVTIGQIEKGAWPEPTGVIRSVPALTVQATEGFTNVRHDVDGILRRAPLLIRQGGQYYPSLALGAMLLSSPERKFCLVQDAGETILQWGNKSIPLDRHGNLHISFRSRQNPFTYLSAKSVLSGAANLPSLAGKIVVVGPWAKALGDIHQVQYGRALSAVEVHANIIDNLLSGTFISRPAWARGAELVAIAVLGVLSTVLLSQAGAVLSGGIVLAASSGSYWLCRTLLMEKGLFVSPLLPMQTPLVVLMGVILLKYGIEARKVSQRNRELHQAQEVIEEVAEEKSELESINLKLAEVDRLKSMFIASMSHELRTPLNSIIGFTSILIMGLAGPLNEEQHKQLAMVKSSSLHLLELINDVIDLSKIEAGKIDIRLADFDLAQTVREVLATFQVAAEQKSLRLICEGPSQLIIHSDVRRIRQILVNLIGNAVKFTEAGEVSVIIRQCMRQITVAVCDSGVGIRLEDIDKLFRYFSQISTDGMPKHEGSGLGLYLSKRLADLLGGTLLVESEFGKGSIFTLSLPQSEKTGDEDGKDSAGS